MEHDYCENDNLLLDGRSLENKRAIIAHLSHFLHKMNSTFFVPIVSTCDPRGWGQFLPQGHHMNKI